ncbi:MAG: hypothetical protein JW787_12475 [Sedimentisphaerales bacterium]|nr:hypothetical protein [Sedimentisphaerales bacterium]
MSIISNSYKSFIINNQQLRGRIYFLILLTIFIISQPVNAGSGSYKFPDVSSIYVFTPENSGLIAVDGSTGVSTLYSIEGFFEFYVNTSAKNAYFREVNTNLKTASGDFLSANLNDIFNLTDLVGVFNGGSSIIFIGKTKDGTDSDISLTLSFDQDTVFLDGKITPTDPLGFTTQLSAVAVRKYGGGVGSINNPYLINTALHMNIIGLHPEDWNSNFKMMDNINLSAYKNKDFNIIGYYKNKTDNKPFSGTFNGNNKKITGFTYKSSAINRIGLFGYINGEKAQIKDLGIVDPNISADGGEYIGSLTAHFANGIITNCYVAGGHIAGAEIVGALVGWNEPNQPIIDIEKQTFEKSKITHCSSTANVSGTTKIGGLVGFNEGVITDCTSTSDANVTGATEIGGLVGLNKGIIIDCISAAHANITGISQIGGLAGTNDGIIMDCNSTADPNVTGTIEIGGLAGLNNGLIADCNSTAGANVNGITKVGGMAGSNTGIITDCNSTADGVAGTTEIGGLAGLNTGIISDCDSIANGVAGTTKIGGMAGLNNGLITDCNSNAAVTGDSQIGGFVGFNCSIIRNCNSAGAVSGNKNVGALAGNNSGNISDSSTEGSVVGQENVGGITGINNGGYIKNCSSINTINGKVLVGGLAGINSGNIINSSSAGEIAGDSYVGGCAGKNYFYILNCLSTADVEVIYDYAGGLAGSNESNGIIENCYSTGSVSGRIDIGGLLGFNDGVVMKCYSTGSVIDNYSIDGVSVGFGGLIGRSTDEAFAFKSFWDVLTSSQTNSAGGTGKTTAEMKNKITFDDWGKCSEDINNDEVIYWTIYQNDGKDYPRLSWENMEGDIIEPVFITDLLSGSGTEDDPFVIDTPGKLNSIGLFPYEWDKHFIISTDINMSGYTGAQFNIIGGYRIPFTGVCNGNNHKISNLTFSFSEQNYVGLFGCVGSLTAQISNVGLVNPNINARENVGSLAGHLKQGTFTGCYAENVTVNGHTAVAGLVGYNQVTISDCHSTGNVTGYIDVGGLVGNNYEGAIENCYSNTIVTGDSRVGGLVGNNSGSINTSRSINNVDGYELVGGLVGRNESSIAKCFSSGVISGTVEVGGLAGWNLSQASISNCYSRCSVLAGLWAGGLTGVNDGSISKCYSSGSVIGTRLTAGGLTALNFGTVSASFWDIETSGQTTSGAGTGKTTANMKKKATFTAAGWDFPGIWKITENQDYPKLCWESN